MEFIPSMKLDRSSIGADRSDQAAPLHAERLIALSSWMMILGTIRVLCTFADQTSTFLNAIRLDSFSMRMLSKFVEENQPFLALGVAWPLILGIALRRTRWPELLPAAGVSFLILSIGGLLESIVEWNHTNADGVTFGSFHLTSFAFLHPTLSDVTLGLLGASQLAIEFATAVCCLLLSHQFGSRAQALDLNKQEGARRGRLGRMAIYASIGFLVLMIRLPVWSTYIEILNDSKVVREFILKNDIGGVRRPRVLIELSKEELRTRELEKLLGAAFSATNAKSFLEAKDTYLEIISRTSPAAEPARLSRDGSIIAQAHNNVAWLLATCPDTGFRDAGQSVEHARAAVALDPTAGTYWNTLGVAFYRIGNWDQAKDALSRSLQMRDGGDSFDWFFLAMIDQKQGRRDQALDLYEKAVQWYQNSAPNDDELYRFQVEAALVLGLPIPATKQPPPLVKGRAPSLYPGGPLINRRKARGTLAAPQPKSAE